MSNELVQKARTIHEIADAMMVGCQHTKPTRDRFFVGHGRSRLVWRTCALGAAELGRLTAGKPFVRPSGVSFSTLFWPSTWNTALGTALSAEQMPLDMGFDHDVCSPGLDSIIIRLNDKFRWSREKIAGWLHSFANEIEESARLVPVDELVDEFQAAMLSQAVVEMAQD